MSGDDKRSDEQKILDRSKDLFTDKVYTPEQAGAEAERRKVVDKVAVRANTQAGKDTEDNDQPIKRETTIEPLPDKFDNIPLNHPYWKEREARAIEANTQRVIKADSKEDAEKLREQQQGSSTPDETVDLNDEKNNR